MITLSKFEIGEQVWYKGGRWEIADHLHRYYLLWKSEDFDVQVPDWVPEDEIARAEVRV